MWCGVGNLAGHGPVAVSLQLVLFLSVLPHLTSSAPSKGGGKVSICSQPGKLHSDTWLPESRTSAGPWAGGVAVADSGELYPVGLIHGSPAELGVNTNPSLPGSKPFP